MKTEKMMDATFMKQALALARKGAGWVNPNPLVGAVVVKNDVVIGEGYHMKYGDAHAEVNALAAAREPVTGSTLYVTLEPCSHHGKTPPCVQRIIDAGIARVVIAVVDPNPLVRGRGIETLMRHGIETTVGVLEERAKALNEPFFTFMTRGTPFVTVKFAQTLDGRIAAKTGHSRWISCPRSLIFAHRLRSTHDAVLVGIGTVLTDNPQLTVRRVKGHNPLRIVLDSHLQIPLDAAILTEQDTAKTLIAVTGNVPPEKKHALEDRNIEVLVCSADESGRVSLADLMTRLGKRGITSLLVEGGSQVITASIREELFDRILSIIAPKIMGQGIAVVGDLGNTSMKDARHLTIKRISRSGADIIMDLRKDDRDDTTS